MKVAIFAPVVALLVTEAVALPTPIPTSVHVPQSQDPSPQGSVPKYALVEGNPLEERTPLALSRFPTDNEDKANDRSPPRPFLRGLIVKGGKPGSPPGQKDASALEWLVEAPLTAVALPTPSSSLPQDEEKSLEARDPLSRFPTDDEKEAADPSPPRPFPPGHPVERNGSSAGDIIEPHTSSPPVRNTEGPIIPEGPITEINDPSPPMPFPPGHPVEANTSTPSPTMAPRTPITALPGTEGSNAAAASDPSPPRPFPPGHPLNTEPQGHGEISPHHAHGGYFPPSNPPVVEPTTFTDPGAEISTVALGKRSCPIYLKECRHPNPINIPGSTSTSTSNSKSASN